jgi:hypothetical protein
MLGLKKTKELSLKGSARLHNESFAAYKKRRTMENKIVEKYLAGRVIWQGKSIWSKKLKQLIVRGQGPFTGHIKSLRAG